MPTMSRTPATAVLGLALAGLACAGRNAEVIDPDLQPLEASAPREEPVFEPDEVIETPSVGVIGDEIETTNGPTQKVEIEDEGSPDDQVVAQPKRTKSGSFMSGIGMNPNK